MPVYVVRSAELARLDAALAEFDVRFRDGEPAAGTSGRFLQKWLALEQQFAEQDLLFLDADTIWSCDPEQFFDAVGPEDFHARLEPACSQGPYPMHVGRKTAESSYLNHELYRTLADGFGCAPLPVFNTGVMLFKHGLHRRLAARLDELRRMRDAFLTKRIPYPCTRPRLFDQVLGALVLGRIEGLAWRLLTSELSPFFEEQFGESDPGRGMVMHVWTALYGEFLLQEEGEFAAQQYQALPKPDARRDWLFNVWLRLGSSSFRLPDNVLAKWARAARRLRI